MSQILRDVIRKRPIFFEAIPPPRRASPAFLEDHLTRLVENLRLLPRLSAVNIPEIVDENHLGRPFYRTHDPRAFSRMVRDRIDVEVVVNKVVVHLPSHGEFLRWTKETVTEYGLRNLVLVGGSSHIRSYPGPNVLEAAGIVSHLFHADRVDDGLSGCVTIPSRPREAERLFTKTLTGSFFATTQILYDADGIKRLLREYDRLCRRFDVEPATILLSFAPLHDSGDLEFVRWLGIDVPEGVEERVLADGRDTDDASIRFAMRLYRDILAFARKNRIRIPLGVNVEEVSRHNMDAAMKLARRILAGED